MDEERLGPDGTPRSKGIAFVEFTEHEHALCALRQLNNNPAAFSKVRADWQQPRSWKRALSESPRHVSRCASSFCCP